MPLDTNSDISMNSGTDTTDYSAAREFTADAVEASNGYVPTDAETDASPRGGWNLDRSEALIALRTLDDRTLDIDLVPDRVTASVRVTRSGLFGESKEVDVTLDATDYGNEVRKLRTVLAIEAHRDSGALSNAVIAENESGDDADDADDADDEREIHPDVARHENVVDVIGDDGDDGDGDDPRIRGGRDDGDHLFDDEQGCWVPDTPENRDRIEGGIDVVDGDHATGFADDDPVCPECGGTNIAEFDTGDAVCRKCQHNWDL